MVALAVSAEKPCAGSTVVTCVPRVRITLQPPENVPSATATAQLTFTQLGTPAPGASRSPATSVRTITPIVFCASFVPCASATSELESTWLSRKPVAVLSARRERVSRSATRVATIAAAPQTNGATSPGAATFEPRPPHRTPELPSATSTEPSTPPTRAWEDDDGIDLYQVITFQMIAPTRPAK